MALQPQEQLFSKKWELLVGKSSGKPLTQFLKRKKKVALSVQLSLHTNCLQEKDPAKHEYLLNQQHVNKLGFH